MRRLASVLVPSSRRSDKSDAPSSNDDSSRPPLVNKKSKVFLSLSRKHLSPLDPPPLAASDLANSSSSSSSGSTTLRTPDDDGLPHTPNKKGSWKSWLGRKNATVSDHPEVPLFPPWQSSQNVLHPSKSGSNEADDVSSHSDDPYGTPDDIHIPLHSRKQVASARANARTLIMNSLVDEPVAPPLLQSSGAIPFPRSCHSSRRLRRRETLESGMHKKLLLARLARLSPSAELSIAPLATKTVLPKLHTYPSFQDDIFPKTDSVNLHSSSLENWVSRPCFEDRQQLWTRSDSGDITRTCVPGSQLGVAALEFSDALELLAGTLPESPVENDDVAVAFDPALEFALPPLALNPDPPMTQMVLEPFSPPSHLSRSTDSPAKSPPPQPCNVAPTLSNAVSPTQQPDGMTASGSTASNDPIPKRGVRFADDDGKDDQIPLGYVLRIRKNKEQKARFLREERERRALAAQLSMDNPQATGPPQPNQVSRAVVTPRQIPSHPLISLNEPPKPPRPTAVSHVIQEEERLRREAERVEMEKLRRSRELAKKQAEERERSYSEELQATRARREAARAGRPLESASFSPKASDRDRSASRDSMHAGSPWRSSIKYTPELVFSPVSPQGGSPSSSLPATPGSQYSFSRPPSLYSAHTTSSEDVRGRDGNRASRRLSIVSDPAKGMLLHPPYDPRASFNPYAWSNMPPVPVIPPVPQIPAIPMVNGVPFYGMDMPLLPPTAPFMVDRFGAGLRSYPGSSGPHTPHSSTSLSRNYSSEGVNSSSRGSSPHSFGSHQRRSSDEATRVAKGSGESRSASYTDVRGVKASPSRLAPPQRSPQRSSWVPPEKSTTKKSSLGPVSGAHSPGAATHTRRRTAVS